MRISDIIANTAGVQTGKRNKNVLTMKGIRKNISYHNNKDLVTIKSRWSGNRAFRGKFLNNERNFAHGVASVLKWRFSPNPQRDEKRKERWNPPVHYLADLSDADNGALVWLGHSSFYMCMDGKRFLFDPVFWSIPFVKRESKLPVDPNIFKHIDYLLISHDHYDHLDKKSVKMLLDNNPDITVVCGIGVGSLIAQWSDNQVKIVEAGWYQRYDDGPVSITFLPAKHWSKRSANDGGSRLWGSFWIDGSRSVYYSGDTGYGRHFSEVRTLCGEPDIAIIAIGAYKPRWFMQRNHISPHEALDAAADVGARLTVPMHYGTFDLSDEPFYDPPHVFEQEAHNRDIPVAIPRLGEIFKI